MVHAEYVLLWKSTVEQLVQSVGGVEIHPERFFHDDPTSRKSPSGDNRLSGGQQHPRRQCQIKNSRLVDCSEGFSNLIRFGDVSFAVVQPKAQRLPRGV